MSIDQNDMEIDFLRNILSKIDGEQCDLIYMEVYEICVSKFMLNYYVYLFYYLFGYYAFIVSYRL